MSVKLREKQRLKIYNEKLLWCATVLTSEQSVRKLERQIGNMKVSVKGKTTKMQEPVKMKKALGKVKITAPLDIEDTKNDAVISEGTADNGKEFKTLDLNPNGKWWTKLGVAKLRLVLEHISQVRRYVESNGEKC